MNDEPRIACELSALTHEQRRRREALAETLRGGVREVTDLPNGYAFHLDRSAVSVQQVDELIALERLCCSFLSIASRTDPASGSLVLEVRGGEAVKAFIAASFGIGGTR